MLVKLCDSLTPTYEWMRLNFTPIPVSLLSDDFFSSADWLSRAKCHRCNGTGTQNCDDCGGSGKDPYEDDEDDQCCYCDGEGTIQCGHCLESADAGDTDMLWSDHSWVFAVGSQRPSETLMLLLRDVGFAVVQVDHKKGTYDYYYGKHIYSLTDQQWNQQVAGYYLVPNPDWVLDLNDLNGRDGTAVFWVPLRALLARQFCTEKHMLSQWEALKSALVGEVKAGNKPGLDAFVQQFGATLPSPKPKKQLSPKKKLAKKMQSLKKKLAKKPAKKS